MGASYNKQKKNVCRIKNCGKHEKAKNLCSGHYERSRRGLEVSVPLFKECHFGYGTPEYISWQQMRQRCANPKHPQFRYYGGKGIKICKRWDSFRLFIKDMGQKPEKSFTLDRINSDKNYSPKNCRWSSKAIQARNRSFCVLNEEKVSKIKILNSLKVMRKEIAKIVGCSYATVGDVLKGKTWKD